MAIEGSHAQHGCGATSGLRPKPPVSGRIDRRLPRHRGRVPILRRGGHPDLRRERRGTNHRIELDQDVGPHEGDVCVRAGDPVRPPNHNAGGIIQQVYECACVQAIKVERDHSTSEIISRSVPAKDLYFLDEVFIRYDNFYRTWIDLEETEIRSGRDFLRTTRARKNHCCSKKISLQLNFLEIIQSSRS